MPGKKVVKIGLTSQSARKLFNELARDSGNVFFTTHAEKRMRQRKITRTEVLRCLRAGHITEGPSPSSKGNWEVRMQVVSAGAPISTVAGLEYDETSGNYLVVITVFR